ncbi:hypothetical protein F4779DRAFT_84374 [Xylariaceae sp. FL0662B]|nr:hypothetical protein F4779DRAFT_84374 [Xylariaceae sp. FL0662B]
MAHNNNPQNPSRIGGQVVQKLNHKVSDLSDCPYDGTSTRIRGRESLVSLQSYHESPPLDTASGSSWSVPFIGSSGGQYQPVSQPSRSASAFVHFKSRRTRAYDTIHEDDSIDMSLLSAAAPPGQYDSYEPVSTDESVGPSFDVTSFSGPISAQDQEFAKWLREHESGSKLTEGLGGGMGRNVTIREQELRTSSPSLMRSFTRSFSMTRTPGSNRKADLRTLGQDEANRRGEVIEVIMEEAPDVDISSMVGPNVIGLDPYRMRHSTLPTQVTKTQVFYPQHDWKPFCMRRPYLMGLVLLSMGLAICQELLYQKSRQAPLISFHDAYEIGPGHYFMFKFVPTIITVTYGVLWQITDCEVKRLEAFYQLSKEGGALAAESINVDYITLFNFTRPLRALQRRHYAVAVSSIATLLAVSLVPTLGSAALRLSPSREERLLNLDVEKMITIHPVLSRLLTMAFFIIAILGCLLVYQLNTRRSGLQSDVKGIAGLASMAVASHIMMDFKDMDLAGPKEIHKKLKNKRYVLRNSSLAPDDSAIVTFRERKRYEESYLPENPHPLMMRPEGCIPFIIGILLFLGFIPTFLFTPASVLIDKAPWVVTVLAVCIKLTWGSLETAIRMMEPYYILSKRHAPAKTLTLDYTALPFATVVVHALFNRHWMVFLVGWGTVMVEALTIFATSLATVEGKDFLDIVREDDDVMGEGLGGQETVLSFTITLALTVAILVYLAAVATAVLARRRHPFLPRQPNTIASVLAFVHASRMLRDFENTARFTHTKMQRYLEGIGKTYGLGWFNGYDDQTHCGIDQEELSAGYTHGVDCSLANKPWNTQWQHF